MENTLYCAPAQEPGQAQPADAHRAGAVRGGMNIDTTTQEMLRDMIGRYVICELLIAFNTFYIREGILIQVTQSFFILFDESTGARVACDLHALKFLTAFPPGVRPGPMSQQEKCAYIGQLRQDQLCRMQALPVQALPPQAPQPFATLPYLPQPGSAGTPAMQFFLSNP